MSYRVLGESLNRDNDDGTDSTLTLDRYQQLLEDTLEQKHGQYRPTMLLRQCADYQNWPAAARIYREMKDHAAEFRCLCQIVYTNSITETETACRNLLYRHSELLEGDINLEAEESAHILLVLIAFWKKSDIEISKLEEHIIKYIPKLADGISFLMESDKYPTLPFSPSIYLAVSRHKLHQFKTNNPFSCK